MRINKKLTLTAFIALGIHFTGAAQANDTDKPNPAYTLEKSLSAITDSLNMIKNKFPDKFKLFQESADYLKSLEELENLEAKKSPVLLKLQAGLKKIRTLHSADLTDLTSGRTALTTAFANQRKTQKYSIAQINNLLGRTTDHKEIKDLKEYRTEQAENFAVTNAAMHDSITNIQSRIDLIEAGIQKRETDFLLKNDKDKYATQIYNLKKKITRSDITGKKQADSIQTVLSTDTQFSKTLENLDKLTRQQGELKSEQEELGIILLAIDEWEEMFDDEVVITIPADINGTDQDSIVNAQTYLSSLKERQDYLINSEYSSREERKELAELNEFVLWIEELKREATKKKYDNINKELQVIHAAIEKMTATTLPAKTIQWETAAYMFKTINEHKLDRQ